MEIEIFEHFKDTYSYIVWKGKHILGEIKEDEITNLLDKQQLIDFYHGNKHKFKVCSQTVKQYVKSKEENDK